MPKCIFCNAKKPSKEHLWGAWWQKYYPVSDREKVGRTLHHVSLTGADGKKSVGKGVFSNAGHELSKTTKVVCKSCNNGWMSQIEKSMEQAFVNYFLEEKEMSPAEVDAVRKWIFLKLCLQVRAYEENYLTIPKLDLPMQQKVRKEIAQRDESVWLSFSGGEAIPNGFRFFVAHCGRKCRRGSSNYMPLPVVAVQPDKTASIISKYEIWLFNVGTFLGLVTSFAPLAELLANFETGSTQPSPFRELLEGNVCSLPETVIGADDFEEIVLSSVESYGLGRMRRNH